MSAISRICGLKLVINGPKVVLVNFEQRRSWNSDIIFPCIESLVRHSLLFSTRHLYADAAPNSCFYLTPGSIDFKGTLMDVCERMQFRQLCNISQADPYPLSRCCTPTIPSFHKQVHALGLKNRNMPAILFRVWHSQNFGKNES